MKFYIEHLNFTVSDIEATVKFLKLVFPEAKIRGKGRSDGGRKWVHFGDENTYLAISESNNGQRLVQDYESAGFNHFGVVVENIEQIAETLRQAGFREKKEFEEKIESRHRVYFLDDNNIEYELIEYFSEKAAERNKYL